MTGLPGIPRISKDDRGWAHAARLRRTTATRSTTGPAHRSREARRNRGRAGEKMPLWVDIRTASRDMQIAFQQRCQQIVGDCRHLKSDVDSYNENYNSGRANQLLLDSTEDIEEIEALSPAR